MPLAAVLTSTSSASGSSISISSMVIGLPTSWKITARMGTPSVLIVRVARRDGLGDSILRRRAA